MTLRALLAAGLILGSVPQDDPQQLLRTFREEFVPITPGDNGMPRTFRMGDAAGTKDQQPVHEVTLRRSFHAARFEVPQNLWEAVMGSNPSRWKGRRNSAEMLSHGEAVEFCRKVTGLLKVEKLIGNDLVVRLPTEAEWEFVARAGTTTKYSFGDDPKDLDAHAWYTGNAAGNDPPVGAKKANPWKLHDVHGYLWEWCSDVWHDSYEGAPKDGSAWLEGGESSRRVLRGGSWKDGAGKLTSAYRWSEKVDYRDDAVGLRCVLAESETTPK